jgi:hypothetical protein
MGSHRPARVRAHGGRAHDLLGVVHHVLAPEHLALWLNDPVEPAPAGVPDGEARPDQVPDERL